MKYDPDALALVNPSDVGLAAMAVVDRLQHSKPEVQVAAVGTALVLLMRLHGIQTAGRILEVSQNIINRTKMNSSPELTAAMKYVEGELG